MNSTDKPASPFVPGARVAVRSRHGDAYIEDFVEKVLKVRSKYADHGNITLRSNPAQQFKVSFWRDGGWHASETGDGWHKRFVLPWTDDVDREIAAARAERERKRVQDALIEHLRNNKCTIDQLRAIEAAIGVPDKVALEEVAETPGQG